MRLVWAALAIAAAGAWAVYAVACDKKTQASAANASEGSAKAYAAGSATSCSAHPVVTASAGGCSYGATDAATAAAECPMHGAATAVTASTHGKAEAADGCCAAKGKATSASAALCPHEGHGAAMAGIPCSGQGVMAGMCPEMHGVCDACDQAMAFDAELSSAGADVQAVPIKNGVMFVYTAATPGQVNAIQSAMARRSENLKRLVNAGDKSKLCPECRTMRGAMASGKVTREVVNIEGGSLTLLTSNDPELIKRIRLMADYAKMAVRTSKS